MQIGVVQPDWKYLGHRYLRSETWLVEEGEVVVEEPSMVVQEEVEGQQTLQEAVAQEVLMRYDGDHRQELVALVVL